MNVTCTTTSGSTRARPRAATLRSYGSECLVRARWRPLGVAVRGGHGEKADRSCVIVALVLLVTDSRRVRDRGKRLADATLVETVVAHTQGGSVACLVGAGALIDDARAAPNSAARVLLGAGIVARARTAQLQDTNLEIRLVTAAAGIRACTARTARTGALPPHFPPGITAHHLAWSRVTGLPIEAILDHAELSAGGVSARTLRSFKGAGGGNAAACAHAANATGTGAAWARRAGRAARAARVGGHALTSAAAFAGLNRRADRRRPRMSSGGVAVTRAAAAPGQRESNRADGANKGSRCARSRGWVARGHRGRRLRWQGLHGAYASATCGPGRRSRFSNYSAAWWLCAVAHWHSGVRN
jgi:hypothetical protein